MLRNPSFYQGGNAGTEWCVMSPLQPSMFSNVFGHKPALNTFGSNYCPSEVKYQGSTMTKESSNKAAETSFDQDLIKSDESSCNDESDESLETLPEKSSLSK